jgi:hypothetical protein
MVVVVYHDRSGDRYTARWLDVVGFLVVHDSRDVADEMTRESRRRRHRPPTWSPKCYPIVAAVESPLDGPVRVLYPRADDLRLSTVVRCDWPMADDRKHAVRIARELVRQEERYQSDAPGPREGCQAPGWVTDEEIRPSYRAAIRKALNRGGKRDMTLEDPLEEDQP